MINPQVKIVFAESVDTMEQEINITLDELSREGFHIITVKLMGRINLASAVLIIYEK